MAIHNRRKGLKKHVVKQKRGEVEYIGAKKEDSIKFAKVDCYKTVKGESVLAFSKKMIVKDFYLNKLKYDLIKVNVLIEWDQYGKI